MHPGARAVDEPELGADEFLLCEGVAARSGSRDDALEDAGCLLVGGGAVNNDVDGVGEDYGAEFGWIGDVISHGGNLILDEKLGLFRSASCAPDGMGA